MYENLIFDGTFDIYIIDEMEVAYLQPRHTRNRISPIYVATIVCSINHNRDLLFASIEIK